jgi:hypothetical protein
MELVLNENAGQGGIDRQGKTRPSILDKGCVIAGYPLLSLVH